jgi:hypothetical protein
MDEFTLGNLATLKLKFEYFAEEHVHTQESELKFPLYEVLDNIRTRINPVYDKQGTRLELWQALRAGFVEAFPNQNLDKLSYSGLERLWKKLNDMESEAKKEVSANANPG